MGFNIRPAEQESGCNGRGGLVVGWGVGGRKEGGREGGKPYRHFGVAGAKQLHCIKEIFIEPWQQFLPNSAL